MMQRPLSSWRCDKVNHLQSERVFSLARSLPFCPWPSLSGPPFPSLANHVLFRTLWGIRGGNLFQLRYAGHVVQLSCASRLTTPAAFYAVRSEE